MQDLLVFAVIANIVVVANIVSPVTAVVVVGLVACVCVVVVAIANITQYRRQCYYCLCVRDWSYCHY